MPARGPCRPVVVPTPVGVNRAWLLRITPEPDVVPTPVGVNRRPVGIMIKKE